MLIGPSSRPILPRPPSDNAELKDLIHYLKDLDKALTTFQSVIVSNTFGLAGIRGLSGSGVVAQNFIQSFKVGNLTNILWSFTGFEGNASYILLTSLSKQTWNNFVTETTRTTTDVLINFGDIVTSGTILHCCLIQA